MKYEMIFGDERLFDGAPEDAEVSCKTTPPCNVDFVYYKNFSKTGFFFFGSSKQWLHSESTPSYIFSAMRRIIKEPKRWTWEDKNAGVLPEVGIKCVWVNLSGTETPDDLIYPEVGTEIEIVATTKTYDGKYPVSVFKWLYDDGGSQCYAASGHVEDFNPIETPAEKAQREEDEFVDSLIEKGLVYTSFYIEGIRAAYRKLKGGE